ncbi:MAG: ATP-grasp domain-containing protein [Gemmatimonadales bacterium]|jgi:D-alanine-D-alanine ligase|nr:ATP-grasp domain-containing protein [Gemmatimonadales bacterium]
MHVVILFDGETETWQPQDVTAVMENVHDVRDVLRGAGHTVELVPVRLASLRWQQRVLRADLVFNLCEGIGGKAHYEDYVVGALELSGVPFTGCRHAAITACHRKHQANALLQLAGVPIPAFTLAPGTPVPGDFPLPAIVKPNGEDASIGIDGDSVCTSMRALRKRVAALVARFGEVVIQAYIPGRELNVGFVGSQVLPVSEISFARMPEGMWPIVSYAAKWSPGSAEDIGTEPVCPAPLPAELERRVVAAARKAWQCLGGGAGYGRVDLRVDHEGRPWVLEVNPCPDLSRDAGLARMGRAAGWSYEALVLRIVDEALGRAVRPLVAPQVA